MEQTQLDFTSERRIYSVADLTAVVRELLEGAFPDAWVSGEISNARRAPSGHWYFTLKDDRAQLRCVCFRQDALYLKIKPRDGIAVIARGRVGVYEARGEYQLYVEVIEPQGVGALQLAFERLKKKLAAEGLFDAERKRGLPKAPTRIGIVTSPAGAAVADLVRVIERRFPAANIRLYPARVQGDEAAADVARGIRYFSENPWAQVVIAARGGGSLEDLWAFNEEEVARAIAACSTPVISAVGHQTDFTIADFAADVRAPTPSAAAELAVPDIQGIFQTLSGLEQRGSRALRYRIATLGRRMLEAGLERGAASVRRRLAESRQRLDDAERTLRSAAAARLHTVRERLAAQDRKLAARDLRVGLARQRQRLESLAQRPAPLQLRRLERLAARLAALDGSLGALSPLAILERGYAIVRTEAGELVRDNRQAAPGDRLGVRLHRGRLSVSVAETSSGGG